MFDILTIMKIASLKLVSDISVRLSTFVNIFNSMKFDLHLISLNVNDFFLVATIITIKDNIHTNNNNNNINI